MKECLVRRGYHWMVMFLVVAVVGCGGDSPTDDGGGAPPVSTTSVTVGDFFFNAESIVVDPGATVTWTWVGAISHNVTFASSAITSSDTQINGTHQAAMPTATGAYGYQCTIHPSLMNGSVTVQ